MKVYAGHPLLEERRARQAGAKFSLSQAAEQPEKPSPLKPAQVERAQPGNEAARGSTGETASAKPKIDPAREAAIQAYADHIRQGKNVKIEERDGCPTVVPESVVDWYLSSEAFSDEPIVKEAIAQRSLADFEKEQQSTPEPTAEDLALFKDMYALLDGEPVYSHGRQSTSDNQRCDIAPSNAQAARADEASQNGSNPQSECERTYTNWANREPFANQRAVNSVGEADAPSDKIETKSPVPESDVENSDDTIDHLILHALHNKGRGR
ncbi:hypothetical protein [Qipengyuania qiaonensis]|uniref:Uncharacterized protein n=1 Tax=Qipengyuania qiaonensis TaxID=2867240 RepID=A0ABS7J9Z6_9SPHN|nr:hypothetical protein [Qipengyuania qiaonensis]MBX7484133.1 hypothetical protein [Qipengyuania qiaonensis]